MRSDQYYKLHVMITPSCWLQNEAYDDKWDKQLNQAIDLRIPFRDIQEHNALILDKEVWISNHPYASFTIDIKKTFRCQRARPSRAVILKAEDWLQICWENNHG